VREKKKNPPNEEDLYAIHWGEKRGKITLQKEKGGEKTNEKKNSFLLPTKGGSNKEKAFNPGELDPIRKV